MSYMLKFLVAGESGVGKTTLIRRYIANKFIRGTKNTIGVDFFLKSLDAEDIKGLASGEDLQIQIWDMSGEERFRQILPLYTPGTQGILLCFDSEKSLSKLWNWQDVLGNLVPVDVPRMLIRTKSDLDNNTSVEEIQKFIEEHKINEFIETSSKDGTNVQIAFINLTNRAFAPIKEEELGK